MKISKHGNLRMRERTPYNHKERYKMFKEAITKGKNPQDIKDESIRRYMVSKHNKGIANMKLYKDYIFIYSKHGKRLYTMYKLPKYLLEKGDKNN